MLNMVGIPFNEIEYASLIINLQVFSDSVIMVASGLLLVLLTVKSITLGHLVA